MSDTPQEVEAATQFDELPTAPPKRKIKLSWPGKIGLATVMFWAIIVVIGPAISPYHEADILDLHEDGYYPAMVAHPPSQEVRESEDA